MTEEIKFSWCQPKEWIDDKNVKRWSLPKSGEEMGVSILSELSANDSTDKQGKKWLQMFDCPYRVSTENIDWSKWNGCVYSDIDSGKYYDNVKQFDYKAVFHYLYMYLTENFGNWMYAMQLSNSGHGYHIIFYFDVEKNEQNFKKCSKLVHDMVEKSFSAIHASEIFNYPHVADNCTTSPYQGMYLTKWPWKFGYWKVEEFGKFEHIERIALPNKRTCSDVNKDGKQLFMLDNVKLIDDCVKYKDHHQRWGIYDALIAVWGKKEEVTKRWTEICEHLPEGNGHDLEFYKNEPERNKWYERYDSDYVNIDVLKQFGYTFKNQLRKYKFQYVFEKRNKEYVKQAVVELYLCKKIEEYELSAEYAEKYNEKIQEAIRAHPKTQMDIIKQSVRNSIVEEFRLEQILLLGDDIDVFDNKFDIIENISQLRNDYNKEVFDYHDLHICSHDKDDVLSYKEFIDLYYRDEMNLPTVRYDILSDTIYLYSYDIRNQDIRWHIFKEGNELSDWKSSTCYNKVMKKGDFEVAIRSFIPKNYMYNPIVEYLEKLDESIADVEKLETFFIRHLKAEDTLLNRTMTKNFFIAAVKKQLCENGFVFPHMLCLMGPTNNNKSYSLTEMFTINDKPYTVQDIRVEQPDSVIGPLINGSWLVQFGERRGISKTDNNANKQFVDRINIMMYYQKKYENEVTEVIPRVVVAMSTNDDKIFNDYTVTADKRTWLIECNAPAYSSTIENRKAIKDEKDIIWATAYKLYKENPDIDLELDGNLFKELGELQNNHKTIDKEEVYDKVDEMFNHFYNVTCNSKYTKFESQQDFMRQYSEINEHKQIFSYGKQLSRINCIPCRWFSEWARVVGFDSRHTDMLKDYLEEHQWVRKPQSYMGRMTMCYVNDSITTTLTPFDVLYD